MSTTQTFAQLSFQINNQAAPNTIYITTDPTVNKLSFVITTNTDGTGFTPGQPVPKSQASQAAGSLIYLDLSNLNMTAEEFAGLAFSADGWSFESYASPGQLVCMTPTADVTLDAGGAVTAEIKNLVLSNPPASSSVQLTATYYRVQQVTQGNMGVPANFQVALQTPPDGKEDLHASLLLEVSQIYVVNSIPDYADVANSMSLVFSPGATPRDIVAGDETSFTVSFVYAAEGDAGYGALATVAQANLFSFLPGANAQNWNVNKGASMQSVSWELVPPAGQPILGKGAGQTVEFLLGNVVTDFRPGPTLMMISYKNVPGYMDGSYSILLEKVQHVSIQSFTASPNPSHLDESSGQAQVILSWLVYDAVTVSLMPGYGDVTDETSQKVTIQETTPFTLTAVGHGSPANVAYKNLTATVLPVINSFTAQPSAIYYKDFPRNVFFAWNVNTNDNVRLTSSVTGEDANQYQPVGNVTKAIGQPQMMTLTPIDEDAGLLLKRDVILSGFEVQAANAPVASPAGFVAASPNAGFVAATNPAQNQLSVLDTLGYQLMGGSAVPTGKTPLGVAFSPDGSLIFAANSGDGTVSVIQVTATQTSTPYSFTPLATVQVGGSPQQVAVSPDGKYLYVTVDNGQSQNGSLAVFQNGGGGQFTLLTTLATGAAPRGVAVAPSGAQVFAANSGDTTVTVVGVASHGAHSLANPITNLGAGPTGLAVTPDGNWLLVACSGSNTVYGINTQYPGTSPRRTFTVGKSPQQISIAPSGAYVFVTNSGDGTVSLLSYDTNSQYCKVLEPGIPAGTSPNGVAVSSEGGLAVVANLGAGSLTVLTLAEYQEQVQPVTVGNQPTSVAAAPDGSRVFAWHNSSISVQEGGDSGAPSTGFYVYETTSQTAAQQMQGSSIIACAFSPVASAKRAFVTQSQQGSIGVIDTDTYQPVKTLTPQPTPTSTSRYPLNLATSADGTTLFAVVANGGQQYSLVVYETDAAQDDYTLVTDALVFKATMQSTYILLGASPDGSKAFVVDSVDRTLWMAARNDDGAYVVNPNPVKVGASPTAITVLPDGSKVFVLNKGGGMTNTNSISVVDTSNMQVSTVYLPEGTATVSLNDMTVSPDGTRIFATDSAFTGIRVMDAATLRFIQTISWTAGVQFPYGIAVLPDGSQIFTANTFSNNIGIVQQVQPA